MCETGLCNAPSKVDQERGSAAAVCSASSLQGSGGKAGRHEVRKTHFFAKSSQIRQGPLLPAPTPRWPVCTARVEWFAVFWGVSAEAFPFMFWAVLFRLVLNSNRIEIEKLGGYRPRRAPPHAHPRGQPASTSTQAAARLRAGHRRRRATWRVSNARHASLGWGFERRGQLGARQTEARRGEARRGEATALGATHSARSRHTWRRSRRSPPYGSPRLPAAC